MYFILPFFLLTVCFLPCDSIYFLIRARSYRRAAYSNFIVIVIISAIFVMIQVLSALIVMKGHIWNNESAQAAANSHLTIYSSLFKSPSAAITASLFYYFMGFVFAGWAFRCMRIRFGAKKCLAGFLLAYILTLIGFSRDYGGSCSMVFLDKYFLIANAACTPVPLPVYLLIEAVSIMIMLQFFKFIGGKEYV